MTLPVFVVQSGDCVECGTHLVSLHLQWSDAVTAALAFIKEKESDWIDQPNFAEWEYVEIPFESHKESNILKYWKTRDGYDIVIVTSEEVL